MSKSTSKTKERNTNEGLFLNCNRLLEKYLFERLDY